MEKRDWDKTSENYYEEILSPIKDAKENPLFQDLKELKNKSSVIDLGCGLGELEPTLSKQFEEVTAIDFSKEMIQKAEEANSELENVTFQTQDMTNLSEFKNKFDVAISINSIIAEDPKQINKILKEIYKTLKQKGNFIAILPSMEVYAYLAILTAEKENPEKAKQIINSEQHDFRLGTINFDGKQKTFYRFEIEHRLKKTGFKEIQIKKVLYPWKEFEEAGQPSFPEEELLPWDWYVKCKKD